MAEFERKRVLRWVLAQPWWGYGAGLAAVAAITVAIGLLLGHAAIANSSMLYLLAVLAAAVVGGRGPAILASVAAFLAFDYFFVEPVHTFTVHNPDEWLALLLFLVTAIITGQLAADLRRRARESEQREREAVVLYDVARLLAEPDLDHALGLVAERLRHELDLAGVVVSVQGEGSAEDGRGDPGSSPAAAAPRGVVQAEAGDPAALALARAAARTPSALLGAGSAPTRLRRASPGRWIRVVPPGAAPHADERLRVVPVKAGRQRVGSLLLVRWMDGAHFTPADTRLLSAVAAQLGAAVERSRLRREATEAEVLRRADELKTALLNAVSHDLRTPLASIIASAGSLLQRDVEWTEAERREFAEAIEAEALRLNGIVSNLLDLSRLEAGSLRPRKGWYDLEALIDDVLGRLRPRTADHHIVVTVPPDLPPVPLDVVEIDQVLTNLIENAVRYTPPHTTIEISVRRAGESIEVAVADNGPGIPPPALPRLFEPFYRVERPATGGGGRVSGTGLGLAVARGLVEAHGGTIRAENRAAGGARFVFTLPLTAPDIDRAPAEMRL